MFVHYIGLSAYYNMCPNSLERYLEKQCESTQGKVQNKMKVTYVSLWAGEGPHKNVNFPLVSLFSSFKFLATLVALHFTPVSESVSRS